MAKLQNIIIILSDNNRILKNSKLNYPLYQQILLISFDSKLIDTLIGVASEAMRSLGLPELVVLDDGAEDAGEDGTH